MGMMAGGTFKGRWSGRAKTLGVGLAMLGLGVAGGSVSAQGTDLQLTGTAGVTNSGGINQLTHDYRVRNNGPDVTSTVTVTITLPPGTNNTARTLTGAGSISPLPAPAGGVVQAVIPSLGVSEERQILLTSTVGGAAGQEVRTYAAATMEDRCEMIPDNNAVVLPSTLVTSGGSPAGRLEVTQIESPDPTATGDLLNYFITVRNAGAGTANNVAVVDTIPSGTEFVMATTTAGTWSRNGNVVTFSLGTLPFNSAHTLSVVVRPRTSGRIVNVAAAYADAPSVGSPVSSGWVESTDVIGDPPCTCMNPEAVDLDITKSGTPAVVSVGDAVTYTITAQNNGVGPATQVLISDAVPTGMRVVSASSTRGTVSQNGNTVHVAVDRMNAGSAVTVTIVAVPDTSGVLVNWAQVSSYESPTPVTANSSTTVNPSTDLSAAITANPATVKAGEPVDVTVTVFNSNPGAEADARVSLSVPFSATYGQVASASVVGQERVLEQQITAIPAGGNKSTVFRVSFQEPGVPLLLARVLNSLKDTYPDNNVASTHVTVTPQQADVAVSMTRSADLAPLNSPFTYYVTVTNNGPDSASNIQASVTLPDLADYSSHSLSGTGIVQTAGLHGDRVLWQIRRLYPGHSASLTLIVIPKQRGTLSSSVLVTASQQDPDFRNNWTTQLVPAMCCPQLVTNWQTYGSLNETTEENYLLTGSIVISNYGPACGPLTQNATIDYYMSSDTQFDPNALDANDIRLGGGQLALPEGGTTVTHTFEFRTRIQPARPQHYIFYVLTPEPCDTDVEPVFPDLRVFSGSTLAEVPHNTIPASVSLGTDLGVVDASLHHPLTFTLYNDGDVPLNLGNVRLTGSPYFRLARPVAAFVPPGGSVAMDIDFYDPDSDHGSVQRTVVSIPSDDPANAPYKFELAATVYRHPDIDVSYQEASHFPSQPITSAALPSPFNGTYFGQVKKYTSVQRTFTIRNTGRGPLNITVPLSAGGGGGRFTVISQPPSVIPAAGRADFTVRFSGDANPGQYGAVIRIVSNDPDAGVEQPFDLWVGAEITAPEIAVVYAGNGQPIVDGQQNPNPSNGTYFYNDAGVIYYYTHSTFRTYRITNFGNAPLALNRATVSGTNHAFSIYAQPATALTPGASTLLTVRFSPPVPVNGEQIDCRAVISIPNDDEDESPYNFAVGATVVAPEIGVFGGAVAIADGATTDSAANGTYFGTVQSEESTSRTFTIRNTGSGFLRIPGVSISGPDADHFRVTLQPADLLTTNGVPTTFVVEFTADTDPGYHRAIVTIQNDDPNESPYEFAVGADVVVPEIQVTNGGADVENGSTVPSLGPISYSDTATTTFLISNLGNGNLNVEAIAVLGPNADMFSIISQPPPPATLGPGGTLPFTLQFTAGTTPGNYSATISIPNNDADERPFEFVVGGTVAAPEIDVYGGDPPQPVLDGSMTTSSANGTYLGVVTFGQTTETIYSIVNSGVGRLDVGTVTLQGPNAGMFSVINQPANRVNGGGSTEVVIRFTGGTTAGDFATTVTIPNSDGDENPFEFRIGATVAGPEMDVLGGAAGMEIQNGDANPSLLDGTDFGPVLVDRATSRTFRIVNRGGAALELDAVTATPRSGRPRFTVTSGPGNNTMLAPNEETTFVITFQAPSTPDSLAAIVSIPNNDPNESPYTFEIVADVVDEPEMDVMGGDPPAPVASDPTSAPSAENGTLFSGASDSHTFTIYNNGTDPLVLGAPVVAPVAGPASFSVTGSATTVQPGNSASFTVTYSGTDDVTTALIRIPNDDSDEGPFYEFLVEGSMPSDMSISFSEVFAIDDGSTETSSVNGTAFSGSLTTNTFTIHNDGIGELDISSYTVVPVSGTGTFTILPATGESVLPASIAPGMAADFRVEYQGSGGVTRARIVIQNDDPDENPYDFEVEGNS